MLNQKRIMLLITEGCNLRCRYCYEHQKNGKKMSFKTAKSILDNALQNASPKEPIVIEIFGGEAFINFHLIREIDDYLQQNYMHLNIKYETTTNGTLVHGEIKDWLYQHKDNFFIALSLDGTKEMHDLNRRTVNDSGSFDNLDIDFFARTWPSCPAKMTISEQTLPYLAEGIAYLDSRGFRCDATLSIGVDWDQEKNIPILIEDRH